MSAWVVSKNHIDLLVSAIIERGIAVKFAHAKDAVPATPEFGEKIGRLLWAENIRSVIYRCRLDGSDEEAAYLQDLGEYRFRFYPGIRESAVDKALACFDYQACECPDYETTAAFSILRQLKNAIGERAPGYDNEPWGFDSEASVMAASIPPVGA